MELHMSRQLICLLIFFVYANDALAQQRMPKANALNNFAKLDIPNIAGEIKIDGVLDDTQWQQAKELELNYVTSPFENTRPPVTTQVKMFENGDTLYVAFKAQDPRVENISAFYRDRDGIWSDDLVGIKLDTFNAVSYTHLTLPTTPYV